MEFLIFSFQIIPYLFSNYTSSKTFEVHTCESMENILKIKVYSASIRGVFQREKFSNQFPIFFILTKFIWLGTENIRQSV